MSVFKTIAGRVYANAGRFPTAFAKEYARKRRAEGWWVRLVKLKPPYEHNRNGQPLTYRVWLGGSNAPKKKTKLKTRRK